MDAIKKIGLSLLVALMGAYWASTALSSGAIRFRTRGHAILRATAPIEFWLLVVGALALCALGIWFAVVSVFRLDPSDTTEDYVRSIATHLREEYGITGRKVFQYLGLFGVLVVIDSIYLKGLIDGPDEITLGALAKLCLVSALPFGVLAFFDKTWRSRDAAPIALGAWAAVFWFFTLRFGAGCPPMAALLFAPLVFSALVGHTVGTLRHLGG